MALRVSDGKQFLRSLPWNGQVHALYAALGVILTGLGFYNHGAWRLLVLVAAAIVAVHFALRPGPDRAGGEPAQHALLGLFGLAVVCNAGWATDPELLPMLRLVLGFSLVLVLAAPHLPRSRVRIQWPLHLLLAGAFYVAVVRAEPEPYIDVWFHLNRGADALLRGDNPYTEPVPDFYQGRSPYGFEAPGFVYPPLVLAIAAPARWLGVDVRLALVLCLLAGAWLVRAAARRAGGSMLSSDLIGLLYLWTPRQSFVLESSHTEPLSGLLLAAAVYCLVRGRRRCGAALLGLLLGSKQYLVVLAPLALGLLRTPQLTLICALTALLPWLPFLAWDARALWAAAFDVHMDRPARPDALTLNAWLLDLGKPTVHRLVALGFGACFAVLGALRLRSTGAIVAGMAATLIVTLLFGPQAFANYFALTAWILTAALACAPPQADPA